MPRSPEAGQTQILAVLQAGQAQGAIADGAGYGAAPDGADRAAHLHVGVRAFFDAALGAITVVGLNTLVRAGEDLTDARNLIIVAIILVFGIGGMTIFTLGGIGLAGIAGVVLNLVLPKRK